MMENDIVAPIALDPFEQWLSERHRWLQTAAAWLIKTRAFPNATGISELADLCVIESSKQTSENFEAVSQGALARATSQTSVRLKRISEVAGVNAIKNGATLDFGSAGISLIYGPNGSGKSGFSRLIKQLCGSRAKEDLLCDVFATERQPPSARVCIATGDTENDAQWTLAGGPIPHLRHVHVFDTAVASLYFGDKNEATYEGTVTLAKRSCKLGG